MTMKQLGDVTYAALRIVAGAMFMCHGLAKLFGAFGAHAQAVGSQMWIGGIVELVGGLLIAVGLFARPAAFVCAGQMAVAYFQFHWKLDFTHYRWLPLVNGADDTVLYCFVFLVICTRGAGIASLDRAWRHVAT